MTGAVAQDRYNTTTPLHAHERTKLGYFVYNPSFGPIDGGLLLRDPLLQTQESRGGKRWLLNAVDG